MFNRVSRTTTISLLVVTAFGASVTLAEQFQDRARVRSVTPQYERVNAPHEECYTEYVEGNSSSSNNRSVSGSIIGGITGAIVGNQIGQGHGKEVATAVGAITGAVVGDRVQNGSGGSNTGSSGQNVQRCHTVDGWENRFTGYRVSYDYHGHQYTSIMPYDPGDELKVRVSVTPY